MSDFRKRAEEAAKADMDVTAIKMFNEPTLRTLQCKDIEEGFVRGASWALANLPRCGTCKYLIEDLFVPVCKKRVHSDELYEGKDFGCILHSDLDRGKE
jgi:hypothetical protein